MVVVAALVAGACSPGDSGGGGPGGEGPDAAVSAEDSRAGEQLRADELAGLMTAAATGLPDEPHAAARALVHQIVTAPSDNEAIGAVGEVLRRSGLPIVMGDGTVVALPDDGGYPDLPVLAGFLRDISRSVRSGMGYPASLLSDVFVAMGVSDGPIAWPALAYAIAGWAEEPDAPAFMKTASSAVRALSAERGQPIDATRGADETSLDTIQMLLLGAHVASEAYPRVEVTGTATTPAGNGPPRAATGRPAASDACQQLRQGFQNQPGFVKGAMGGVTWFIKTANEQAILQLDADVYKGKLPPGVTEGPIAVGLKRAGAVVDLLGYLGALMTLAGLTFEADAVPEMHYKHVDGDTSTHRTLRVTASFDSGYSDEEVACMQVLGVKIPKNGPLTGFGVEWKFVDGSGTFLGTSATDVAQGSRHLRVANNPGLGPTATTLDADGVATLTVKPPVEAEPVNRGDLQYATGIVEAKLVSPPWKLGDYISFISPSKLANAITLEKWLPRRFITVPITFHGLEPVTIDGTQRDIFLLVGTLRSVGADLYSCEGLKGPWQGVGNYGGYDLNPLGSGGLDIAQRIAPGIPRPPDSMDGWTYNVPTFSASPGSTTSVMIIETVYADINLQASSGGPRPVRVLKDGRTGSVVGNAVIVLGRDSMVHVDIPVAKFPAVQVEGDARCPDRTPHWDGA